MSSACMRQDSPEGAVDIRTDLVVGCDGRHSTLRARAGFTSDRIRRADGRDVVPHPAQARRSGRRVRPRRARPHDRDAQSRRLLAVRVRHSEGRHRGVAARGLDSFRER